MTASEQIDAQWIVDHPATYDSRARKIAAAYLAQARLAATLEQALASALAPLETIAAMERQPGEELGNSIIMQVRTHDLVALRALLP